MHVTDTCHVNRTFCYLCLEGPQGSSHQITTRGISSETTLNALSNAYAHKNIKNILSCLFFGHSVGIWN
jgi:hypothetical protein